jgi:hypothetical protein
MGYKRHYGDNWQWSVEWTSKDPEYLGLRSCTGTYRGRVGGCTCVWEMQMTGEESRRRLQVFHKPFSDIITVGERDRKEVGCSAKDLRLEATCI